MPNLVTLFMRSLTGRCLECGSKNLDVKVEVVESNTKPVPVQDGFFMSILKLKKEQDIAKIVGMKNI